MRGSWIRAALLGVILGPAPLVGETADASELPADGHVSKPRTAGHAICGHDFYVWDEDPREATAWAVELLASGSETSGSTRWRTIAMESAALPTVLTDAQQVALTRWLETESGDARLASLGLLLCLLPSLDRTCLVASWATSPHERVRRALASALAAPFEAVGVRAVLEHLRDDASPQVRQLARSAAAIRRGARA